MTAGVSVDIIGATKFAPGQNTIVGVHIPVPPLFSESRMTFGGTAEEPQSSDQTKSESALLPTRHD
jgi:hypothetical protein